MRPVNPALLFSYCENRVMIKFGEATSQAKEVRRALVSEGIYAMFQKNFAAIDKDNQDDF